MDNETYDQIEVDSDTLPKEQSQWLKENPSASSACSTTSRCRCSCPPRWAYDLGHRAAGRGGSQQNKEAFVETGHIRVPPFIEIGQVVKVNPETGEYMGKA